MDGYKKAIFIIIIAAVFFSAGFGLGYWRSNQIGDVDSQIRIAELEQLNNELDIGYTKLREDYLRSEARLTEFLTAEADRNQRASDILRQAGSTAGEASESIGRAITGFNRLSEAIEILLGSK